MEVKILDTGIFIKENFLHGKKMKSLLNLSMRGIIDLYITEITYNELINNFNKFLDKSISNHNKFTKSSENWVLRNDSSTDVLFKKLDKKIIYDNFIKKLDNLISKKIIKVIPYNTVNIKNVFDDYFQSKPPFGNGDKKSEFPDAFSLELIKQFLNSKGLQATIFSTDNDLISCSTKQLPIIKDYDIYLNEKFKHLEKLKTDITEKLFIANQEKIKTDFIDWYESNLDDFSLYYEAVNYKEIHDIEIEEVEVNDLGYKIINIEDDVVIIEVNANVAVVVNVLTDDENLMYYDSDDRSYHYLETTYETFQKTFEASMILHTEIISENDYCEDFEVESINENKKIDFYIKDDYHY